MRNQKILKYQLKEVLEENKITYPKVAEKMGVSLQTVSNWCNIKFDEYASIPSDYLLKMCFMLKTDVRSIYNPAYYKILQSSSSLMVSEPSASFEKDDLTDLTKIIKQMQRDIEELKQNSDNQINNRKKVSQTTKKK